MKQSHISRVRLISTLTLVFALLLIVKLYSVQVVSGDEFASRAERQYLNSNYSLYDRGSIFFESKDGARVSAATLKSGFTIAINPRIIEDPQIAFEKLSSLIDIDKTSFMEKAAKDNDPYEEIARRVENGIATKIEDLGIPGVSIYREKWRFYPGESMAAQTLGIVAYKGDDYGGRYGLESSYEDVLRRATDGVYVNFFAEIFSNVKTVLSDTSESEGDIVTTIEPSVQAFLERELRKVNDKYASSYTGGIVMDPQTGEIYAMAIDPTFDPNNLAGVEDVSIFTNRLVENVYEMGSIIKPLTMAAGIDSGAITANSTYYDAGSLWLNSRQISNYDGKARGLVPMQEILSQSLNTGTAHISQRMGKQTFAKYFLGYGLGEKTGIDLPNESKGLVNNLTSPRDIEYATASFGQGIAMTPISTARALATLANGGKLVRPHIVQQIKYENGMTKTIKPEIGAQVLKPETTEEVSRMLVHVVDNALRGGTFKISNHSIAAKTGTAQIAKENNRGYYDDRFLHSFFGYFPAYDARFIVFLYTYDPKGVKYASETLTDAFMEMTKFLINYYEIPPDR